MSYSNGRIYTESVNGKQIGVSIGDLMRCFGVVIKATYNGTTYRRQSSDLGVIVAKRQGDSFYAPLIVNGVVLNANQQWTVESRREVNPWARYRPIPCNGSTDGVEHNVPTAISDTVRQKERYGIDVLIDLYKPAEEAGYNDYLTGITKFGEYWLPLRPFGDTHWKRLTDYVKTNDYGQAVNGVGYDHNALPDNVKVIINSSGTGAEQVNGTYFLEPVFADEKRWVVIPPGSTAGRFALPNDHLWMDYYYRRMEGDLDDNTVRIVRGNEGWLSVLDLMGTDGYNESYASVRRRLAIYHMRDSNHQWTSDEAAFYEWYIWCIVTDTTTGEGADSRYRPYEKYPNSWIDFSEAHNPTDNNDNVNYLLTIPGVNLGNVTGKLLVVECWIGVNSSTNIMPIPGFSYELNIVRQNIEITVDIIDKLIFWYVEEEDSNGDDGNFVYAYTLRMYYDPSAFSLPRVLSTKAEFIEFMSSQYDSLNISIGNVTINLLDSTSYGEFNDDRTHGATNFRDMSCVLLYGVSDNYYGQIATVAGKRKNTGAIPAQTKQICIAWNEQDIPDSNN